MSKIFVLVFSLSISLTVQAQDYKVISQQLDELHQKDQYFRILLDSLVRKAKLDWQHPQVQALLPQARFQDSLNLATVKQLLDMYGWMGQDQVGKQANETMFLVIQHADSATMTHYFPLLTQSVELGQSPSRFHAMMLDRILTDRGHPQVYGTQLKQDEKTKRFVPFPIANEALVNERRKKMGLETLHQYLASFNQ
jgi:hypothetical protein